MAITPAHKRNPFFSFYEFAEFSWMRFRGELVWAIKCVNMQSVCVCVYICVFFFFRYHLNHKAENIRQISDCCGFAELVSH